MSAGIIVTRPIPDPAVTLLREAGEVWIPDEDCALTAEQLRSAVAGAEAIITMFHDRIDQAILDAAGPRLRIVANVAVGYDNIDVAACARRGIVVTNTPGVLVDATADLTIGLMLAVMRHIVEGDHLLRIAGTWSWSMSFGLGPSLRRQRLGIVGFGQIGRAVAERAEAFGMEVVYSSRSGRSHQERPSQQRLDLNELLRTSRVVSLHCPLTPETHHLINRAAFSAMRKDAFLINAARGGIVDDQALVDALARGEIHGAALDVFETEPTVHPLLREMKNVVMTPHLGSATGEARAAMALAAAQNVVEVLSGRDPSSPVRLTAW
jgi:lactate dehydrogenase-like 2-hydroxyacid dehydrogenase